MKRALEVSESIDPDLSSEEAYVVLLPEIKESVVDVLPVTDALAWSAADKSLLRWAVLRRILEHRTGRSRMTGQSLLLAQNFFDHFRTKLRADLWANLYWERALAATSYWVRWRLVAFQTLAMRRGTLQIPQLSQVGLHVPL